MSVIHDFIEAARQDRPVYICDVRDAFQREGARPFHIHLALYDGSVRRFALRLPRAEDGEERAFIEEYLNATIYNALSALGARMVSIYVDPADAELLNYASALKDTFQVDLPLRARSGYGKCLNVNARTLKALCDPKARFECIVSDIAKEPAIPEQKKEPPAIPVFARLPKRAAHGLWMGMDIGGTDVKLAASLDGRLRVFKEYDWNPAGFATAEALIRPLLLLTRLMRAAVGMEAAGMGDAVPLSAFDRSASDDGLLAAVQDMEAALGERLRGFDGIGLCFPDVVIRNRIVGGESQKTRGMRENAAADYEAEFAKITTLCDRLAEFVRPGGAVLNINDGPMAAFTTAVEQAAAGRDLSGGFFAHSLGTDLGTGWILPDGSIPEIPLEVYNFIIDLGSGGQRGQAIEDVRSVRNHNTGLPGSLQRYTSQSGAFRLAAKYLPQTAPKLFDEMLRRGMFAREGGRLTVPTAPADMRKPCLEFLMDAARNPDSICAEIFREIGEYLAVTWRETQFILEPRCATRTLYGRLVKSTECFELMREGARRILPDIKLEAADDAIAVTPLMKQLAAHPRYTVAQFAQAVGAIHYACTAREA